MVDENRDKGGGIQPFRLGALSFPAWRSMSGSRRWLCVFFACVTFCACAAIVAELFVYAPVFNKDNGGKPAIVLDEKSDSGKSSVSADSRKVSLDGAFGENGIAGAELQNVHEAVQRFDDGNVPKGISAQIEHVAIGFSRLREDDECYVSGLSSYCKQLGEFSESGVSSSSSNDFGKREFDKGSQSENVRGRYEGDEGKRNTLFTLLPLHSGNSYHSGVYSLVGSPEYVLAGNGLSDVGGTTARALWARFTGTKFGQACVSAVWGPFITFAIMSGGNAALEATYAEDAAVMSEAVSAVVTRAEPVVYEIGASLIEDGLTVSTSELTGVTLARLATNEAAGVTMTAEELSSAVAEDYISLATGAGTGAAESEFWLKTLSDLCSGQMDVNSLPIFSKVGEYLIADYNMNNPNNQIKLEPMQGADLKTWSSSGYGTDNGYKVHVGNFDLNYGFQQPSEVNVQGSSSFCVVTEQSPPSSNANIVRTEMYFYGSSGTVTRTNGNIVVRIPANGTKVTINQKADGTRTVSQNVNTTSASQVTYYAANSDYDAQGHRNYTNSGYTYDQTIYINGGFTIIDDGNTIGSVNSYGITDAATGKTYPLGSSALDTQNFFESGGAYVGNDSPLTSSGEYEGGTADLNQIHDSNLNPSTFQDVHSILDITPYMPATNPSTGAQQPATPSTDVYEPGNANPSKIGDHVRTNPTPSRLQGNFEGKLGELKDAVSDKFPFSVPFNMAGIIKKLQAEPEAPHFTWVFELPTGRQELEVSLAQFSPVAAVLRVMLDAVMMFSLIGLLTKIAQLFELVHGGD